MAKTSDQIDRELAGKALEKRKRGEAPTAPELAALRRFEAATEERARWEYYASIPQKHWRQMSGRQAKIINEQAARYGIPFAGRAVDLPAVVKAIHDWFAANGPRIAQAIDGDKNAALDELRQEKVLKARLERQQIEGQLIPRSEIHDRLTRIAAILRSLGETLARTWGEDARRLLDDSLDECQREIDPLNAR